MGSLAVYRHIVNGNLIVRTQVIHPLGSRMLFGDPIEINSDEYQAKIVLVIKEALAKSEQLTYDEQAVRRDFRRRYNKKSEEKFVCEHHRIGLESNSEILEILPNGHYNKGYLTLNEKRLEIDLNRFEEGLAATISEAFSHCY